MIPSQNVALKKMARNAGYRWFGDENMANSPQARKRIRQTARRTEVNTARRSRIRTYVKKVEMAIQAGQVAEAKEAFVAAQPEIMRGVTKGLIHRNTASRKVSRLNSRIKAMSL
jgi:small subunit ribosomal protein S20